MFEDKIGEYTCAECHKTYNKDWSDEEALEEKNILFPEVDIANCAIVYDDCFNKMMNTGIA